MQSNRHILILGASPFTIPLINTAASLGYRTIVCSNIATDPGLAVADLPMEISILDRGQLEGIMKQYQPVAIVTAASDLATLSIGYLNKKYGLRGITEEQVLAITDKGKFTELQKELELPAPASWVVEKENLERDEMLQHLNFPMIMKPFFSSGSRGVKVVRSIEELLAHHQQCRLASSGRKGYVLQSFLSDYVEVGCEVFVENGKVVFLQTTHKFLNKLQVPTGHCVPGPISASQREALVVQIESICTALQIINSPINLDVMTKPDNHPVIIDMSFRLGGNLLPDIMNQAFGTQPYNRVLSYVVNEVPLNSINNSTEGYTGSFIFGSLTPQQFTEELKNAIESIVQPCALELVFDFAIGRTLPVFTQGSYRFGHALVRTPSLAKYKELYNLLQKAINGAE